MKKILSRECAVKVDAAIYSKWMAESLAISGYQVLRRECSVTKGGEPESWVIELRIEVERR